MKIGVFGTDEAGSPEEVELARQVGVALAGNGCVVMTGACSGLPYEAARAAAEQGAEVWGFSPVTNMEEQREFVPNDDLSIYTHIHFVPVSFPFNADLAISKKYRNVISTAHCDAGIILGGRWGTLNEFTNLVDFGKVAGVLTENPLADALEGLVPRIGTVRGAAVIFDSSADRLVRSVVEELKRRSEG